MSWYVKGCSTFQIDHIVAFHVGHYVDGSIHYPTGILFPMESTN